MGWYGCFTLLALTATIVFIAMSQQPTQLVVPEKITTVEGITEYKLANGLHVLIFPDPSKSTMTVNMIRNKNTGIIFFIDTMRDFLVLES